MVALGWRIITNFNLTIWFLCFLPIFNEQRDKIVRLDFLNKNTIPNLIQKFQPYDSVPLLIKKRKKTKKPNRKVEICYDPPSKSNHGSVSGITKPI